MRKFRVGMDSYTLKPLGLSPFEMLDWVKERGGEGMQFSEGWPEGPWGGPEPGRLEALARRAQALGLYLEWGGAQHIPFHMDTWEPKDLLSVNRAAVEQAVCAGAKVIRSCSGGFMRWEAGNPRTEVLLEYTARALQELQPLFEEQGCVLAVETHFEFTTFELNRLFEAAGAEPGGWLGVCLDTLNLLVLLEDPVAAVERILPWVVSTHVKDGGLFLLDECLLAFTAEAGKGLVDLEGILERLAQGNRRVNLSVEDHGGSFTLPVFDPLFMARFPDLPAGELDRLFVLAREGNHLARGEGLAPVARKDWAARCPERIARDLTFVLELARNQGLRKGDDSP